MLLSCLPKKAFVSLVLNIATMYFNSNVSPSNEGIYSCKSLNLELNCESLRPSYCMEILDRTQASDVRMCVKVKVNFKFTKVLSADLKANLHQLNEGQIRKDICST